MVDRSRSEAFVAAQEGETEAVGALLESYRAHLRILATSRMKPRLSQRVGASDIVQEAMLAAHRDFGRFRGKTLGEFTAWLRAILSHKLLNAINQHLCKRRDARREISIDTTKGPDESDGHMIRPLATRDPSPSTILSRNEDSCRIARLMMQLPPHYRDVIQLRNTRGMRFELIAQRMNRSPTAARLIWLRAIRRLRQLYDQECLNESSAHRLG